MMTRSMLGWGLLALLFYLLSLLLTLPAGRVTAWSGIPLTETSGRLWAGSGTLQVGGEAIQYVHWRLHPIWPWQGALGATITAEHQGWQAAGEVRLGWNGTLRVNDATLSGPLDSPLLTRHLPLPITGQARLHIPRADWRGGLVSADGVLLEVFKPGIILGEALSLGDLVGKFDVVNGRLDGQLHDKGGPLEVAGRIQGDRRGGLTLEASLKARPGAPATLADNLRLLPAGPDGGARLQTRLSAPWLAQPQP